MYCVYDRINRRYLSWRLRPGATTVHQVVWVESWEIASVWADERQARRTANLVLECRPEVIDAHVELLPEPAAVLSWREVQS